MGYTNLLQYLYILILLAFSAFFSGSESCYFSLNYLLQERMRKEKKGSSRLVIKLLKSPNKLLITILVGNMIVNILASAIASDIAINTAKDLGFSDITGAVFSIVIMTVCLLLFGEITPKLITLQRPVQFAKFFSYLLFLVVILLRPVIIIFQWFTDIITNRIMKMDSQTIKNTDIESMITISHQEGIIDKDEKEMFENVYDSMSKIVDDIIIPKPKMFCLSIDLPLKKIIEEVIKCPDPLIPVYKKNRDNILGVIHKKDILPFYFNLKKPGQFKKIIRPVIFVPLGKKINDLLKELQSQKRQLAVIADEYGNVIGFITLDILIEEIVGDYKDEYDQENVTLKKIGKKKYLVRGDMKLDDFNELFKTNFNSQETTTIMGLLLEDLEKIPKKGEKIIYKKFSFTVNSRKGAVIETLLVERLNGD